jgi:hypothetical protein
MSDAHNETIATIGDWLSPLTPGPPTSAPRLTR